VVQLAHQHLVVHRDLKPGNILVTPQGEPKLLDFGIAKLLEADGERPTMPGLRPLTPEHASPEQIRGEAVTTASDVYALGGLLYELLTGRHPHGPTGGAPEALFHRVLEEEPEPPSRAVLGRGEAAGAAEAARARGTDPRRLRRRLAGDLDAIVLHALEKDPRRRYASAEQLAEDLCRHLVGQPVRARRASRPYRAGRFVRRHRLGVSLAAGVALTVLASGVGLKLERDRAVLERSRAVRERQRAERVTDFMTGVFRRPHPEISQGEEITARQLLDEGARRLREDDDLARQPGAWAALADAVGWAYLGLGHHDEAEPLLEEALRLRRDRPETRSEDLATSLLHVAAVRRARERYGEARALAREAVVLLRDGGAASPALARVLNNQAALLEDAGDLEGAEELYREALGMKIRLLGEEHPDVATGKNNLALVLKRQGRYEEAERLYRESLALRRRLHGEGSTEVAVTVNNLALLLQDRGDLAAAEPLLRQGLDLRRRLYGPEHPALASGLNNLAFLLQLRGRHGEAEPLYRRAQKILAARLGREHSRVAGVLRNRAVLALGLGEAAEAESLAARAVEILRTSLGAGHWRVADAGSVLGAALAAQGRFGEAEPLLTAAPAALAAALGEEARQTREARERLARFEAARAADSRSSGPPR
jgi:serine/threonine-protein kinase